MRMNMDDIMQQALNITRAQAGVRPMSASEVAAYAAEIAKGIRTILESEPEEEDFESGENAAPACDPKRSIKENSIICLECGRSFRVLTIRHLRTHGLDARTYKEKYGFKKNTPLACKSLIRVRRKKMNDMRLWTRKKNVPEGQPEEAPRPRPNKTSDEEQPGRQVFCLPPFFCAFPRIREKTAQEEGGRPRPSPPGRVSGSGKRTGEEVSLPGRKHGASP